ncbi:MAG: hypothetical protein US54_C0073G0002 [Candidatus Roizmanbacteria bacterium GW2011_GWA2_37_7]|uniref:LTD domain-containing protein n=1 Tax=Candidatus Roizmanbacteria bacterium GW2011_GWA2_37_7 TaxID=1618481 RepID=A0A0G0GZB0_9BACT|nr:MAG: hypothetical protein US54_C0073G0002 [Candidatus Roizmanbacteria bacterium GW2011_GWA2_37_7]
MEEEQNNSAAEINSGDIIINELMWSGTSVSEADQYLELRNMTDRTINLSGLAFTKYDNTPMNKAPGSLGAAPIFKRLMIYLLEEYDMAGEMSKPTNVVGKPCYAGKTEYFLKGTESRSGCYDTVIKPASPTQKEEAQNP